MSLILVLIAALAQSDEVVLDPLVAQVAVFKPGLVYVVREATVPAGLHSFRLKSVPQALDGTLWVDSPDGAKVSELRTTIDVHAPAGKQPTLTIPDLLAGSVGRNVEMRVRTNFNSPTGTIETVRGKLLSYEAQLGSGALLLPNGHLRSITAYETVDVNTAGLPMETQRFRPRINLRFRVDAVKSSRVRITSLETGAAWVANYRLDMNGANGRLESAAQLGLGSLALKATHVRLVTGVPNLEVKSQLDLASGSTSVANYLSNRPGRLSQMAMDPFEVAEAMLSAGGGQFRGGYGGGGGMGGGGQALVGNAIDFISYDPNDNSLVVRSGEDVPAFLAQAVQASRLEDLHVYDFDNVTLPAGGRITRVLSSTDLPLNTLYRWNVATGTNFDRVLRLHNSSGAGWPAGVAFLQTDGVPLAQVPMPFTAPGQDANLVLGSAEDLLHNIEIREIERQPVPNIRTPSPVSALNEATIEVTNTRTDWVDVELNFDVRGTLVDGAGAVIKSVASLDPFNPSSVLTWRAKLNPGERKVWVVKYRTVIL